MPVNVAVEEPRTGIVCSKAEGDIIANSTDRDNVSPDRIIIVVGGTTSASYNGK